jgi:phage terminase large subunit-like protein
MSQDEVDPRWVRDASDRAAVAAGYRVEEWRGEFVCGFLERFCVQSKGRWAGSRLVLLDWQRDLLMRLFAWRRPDGRRRYRRCYVEVAKKNGKSTLISALCLYLLLADDEAAPEIYLNAVDRQQARIVYDEAARMVRGSPGLTRRVNPIDSRHRLVWAAGNGVILANSSEAPAKDGLNPSAVIFDELHRQPDYKLWDIFEYATGARAQPLTLSITTAGDSERGIWWEQRDYSERVVRGEIDDPTHLGVIYRAGRDDDPDDPATWRKANPSLGVTITEEDFRRDLEEAQVTPRKLAGFLRLRLNVVANADVVFLDPDDWKACAGPPPAAGALAERTCYLGVDLGQNRDLTAVVALWPDDAGGHDIRAWFWLPRQSLEEQARATRQPYVTWVLDGLLQTTPGACTDLEFVRAAIVEFCRRHRVRRIVFDAWHAYGIATALREQDGLPVEFLRQGYASLSGPTKELERLVLSRKIRHGGNPILAWMASNAIADMDAAGNLKLNKRRSRDKIDGLSALVNGLAGVLADGGDGGDSVYESRGILSI